MLIELGPGLVQDVMAQRDPLQLFPNNIIRYVRCRRVHTINIYAQTTDVGCLFVTNVALFEVSTLMLEDVK